MKRIVLFQFLAVFFLMACNTADDNSLSELKGKEFTIDAFFKQVVSKNVQNVSLENDEIVLISYSYNTEKQTITLDNYEVAPVSFAIAFDSTDKNNPTELLTNYVVNGGDDKNWSKSYTAKMAYVPETQNFYISENLEDLVDVEKFKSKLN